jgi:hypothetical protein
MHLLKKKNNNNNIAPPCANGTRPNANYHSATSPLFGFSILTILSGFSKQRGSKLSFSYTHDTLALITVDLGRPDLPSASDRPSTRRPRERGSPS